MSCWRRKIGSDDLKEEKLLEETESQERDWKETFMSCWGRKTGSDDLKEQKLLEETERVR